MFTPQLSTCLQNQQTGPPKHETSPTLVYITSQTALMRCTMLSHHIALFAVHSVPPTEVPGKRSRLLVPGRETAGSSSFAPVVLGLKPFTAPPSNSNSQRIHKHIIYIIYMYIIYNHIIYISYIIYIYIIIYIYNYIYSNMEYHLFIFF